MGILELKDRKAFLPNLMLGVGMALALSCFSVLSQMLYSESGPYTSIIVLGAGLIALVVARSVGELSLMYPGAIGVWTYVRNAWGNYLGLIVILGYIGMLLLVAGVEGKLLGQIFSDIFHLDNPTVVIAILFLLVMAINLRGLSFSKRAQTWMVMLLVLLSTLMALLALVTAPGEPIENAVHMKFQFGSLLEMIIVAFFLFVGFEWITNSANTSRKAAEDIPKVLTLSIIVLVVYYFLFSIAMQAYLSRGFVLNVASPHVSMASILLGDYATYLVFLLSSLAVLTSFNVGLMGATRLVYAVAREGYLPISFATVINRHSVPVWPIIALGGSGLMIAIICATTGINVAVLAEVAALIICAIYVILLETTLRLRTRLGQKVLKQQSFLPRMLINAVAGFMVIVVVAMVFDKGWGAETQLFSLLLMLAMLCAGLMVLKKRKQTELIQKEKSL